eukprot:c15752_g1_i1.p1 GENE.c15752_g1_i1~~c15752_g1_i1.p1  ORF type:complete len:259 (+),score=55.89 c15752_g1_i1:34-810(+)
MDTYSFFIIYTFSCLIFSIIAFVSHNILSEQQWSKSNRCLLMSSFGAFLHGPSSTILSGIQVFKNFSYPDSPNVDIHTYIMAFSVAYFTIDFVVLGLDWKNNIAFCLHHIVCSLYEVVVLYYGYGSYSVMVLMFLGEITNPLQNVYSVSHLYYEKDRNDKFSRRARELVAVPFVLFYFFIRFFVVVIFAIYLNWFFLFSSDGNGEIPIGWRIVFGIIAIGVPIGSFGFGKVAWNEIFHPSSSTRSVDTEDYKDLDDSL